MQGSDSNQNIKSERNVILQYVDCKLLLLLTCMVWSGLAS